MPNAASSTPPAAGAWAPASAGATEGADAAGADGAAGAPVGCAAPPPVARIVITVPSDTLSPIFTFISWTTPPSGAGTSIVALSDSSVISASSAFTVSPGLTWISMTGMSLKSPMSGTRTSATPPGALTGAGGAITVGVGGGVEAAAP